MVCFVWVQIRVYVGGRDKPFKARVAAIAAEADLAVLTIAGDTSTARGISRTGGNSSSSSSSTARISTGTGAGASTRGASKRRLATAGKAPGRSTTGSSAAPRAGYSSDDDRQSSEEEEEFWSLMAPLELAPAPPDPQDRVTIQTLPSGEPPFIDDIWMKPVL